MTATFPPRHASRQRSVSGQESAVSPQRGGRLPATATWVCLGLLVLVFSVYGQVVSHEFLNWDDGVYVVNNPAVRAGLTMKGVMWALTSVYGGNWNPLVWLSHMAAWEMTGEYAGGHAFINVVLHAGGAILLFLALRTLTGAIIPSALVAAIFAVHPLNVEAVAWISARKDVLSGIFFMMTLMAYGHYARRPSARRIAIVAGALALGLMSKPILMTIPALLLLLDIWPLRRRASWRLIVEKVPLVVLSAAAVLVAVIAKNMNGSLFSLNEFGAAERVSSALVGYVFYLRKALVPTPLAALYPSAGGVEWTAVLAFLLLVAVTVAAVRMRDRQPVALVGWLWFLGMLFPVIGIVRFGVQPVADRFAYLPMIGLWVAIVWPAWSLVRERTRRMRLGAAIVACSLVVWSAVLAHRQVGLWHDTRTLFEHSIAEFGETARAHEILGGDATRGRDYARAILHLRRAIELEPGIAQLHISLALAHQHRGDTDDCRRHIERAVELQPEEEEVALRKLAALFSPVAEVALEYLRGGAGDRGPEPPLTAAGVCIGVVRLAPPPLDSNNL